MKYRFAFHAKQRGLNVTRLLARDGDKCSICGEEMSRKIRDPEDDRYITFDHVLPVSAGGRDELSNLRLAHRRCNLLRGNAPVEG